MLDGARSICPISIFLRSRSLPCLIRWEIPRRCRALPGRQWEFIAETPQREPLKHTKKEIHDGRRGKPIPYDVGLQIPCCAYSEMSPEDVVTGLQTTNRSSVAYSGLELADGLPGAALLGPSGLKTPAISMASPTVSRVSHSQTFAGGYLRWRLSQSCHERLGHPEVPRRSKQIGPLRMPVAALTEAIGRTNPASRDASQA
jgi:hypothetical protein